MSRSVTNDYDKLREPKGTSCVVAPQCDSDELCSLNAYHAGSHESYVPDPEEITFRVGEGFVVE